MKKVFKRIILIVMAICIILTSGFVLWAKDSYKPDENAITCMSSNNEVEVIYDDLIIFKPKNIVPTKGFIFYPGGKVEPESYSVLCNEIAKEGYLAIIAPMTLNLAILSPNQGEKVINRFTEIDTWVIGGHSLGGVMAADYALKNDKIKGLALYASYPQDDKLKDSSLNVLSIYGSLDNVAKLDKVKNAVFPTNSEIIEIPGGNHGGFGSYGFQDGDNVSEIDNLEQIKIAAKYTINLINEV